MRRILSICIIFTVIFTVFCGCFFSNNKQNICVQSNVNCLITVPDGSIESNSVFLQIPFYQLYSGEDLYSEKLASKDKFYVGEDVLLEGINVDCLNGGFISVKQRNFSELIDDNYLEGLTVAYGMCYLDFDASDNYDRLQKKVKKSVSFYGNDSYLLIMSLVFSGNISKAVTVNNLYIPELGFSFDFKNLCFETLALPENVICDNEGTAIDFSSGMGIYAQPVISKVGPAYIGGEALIDISYITKESANQICTIINEENYASFSDLEEDYGPIYYEGMKLSDYKKNEEISLDFNYVLSASTEELVETDVIILSLITKAKTEDNSEYWSFYYQPSISPGEYLMLDVLNNQNVK